MRNLKKIFRRFPTELCSADFSVDFLFEPNKTHSYLLPLIFEKEWSFVTPNHAVGNQRCQVWSTCCTLGHNRLLLTMCWWSSPHSGRKSLVHHLDYTEASRCADLPPPTECCLRWDPPSINQLTYGDQRVHHLCDKERETLVVSAKREGTATTKGKTKILYAACSVVVQPSSTSNALQRITSPLTEMAAQAVIGQDILFLFANGKARMACSPQIIILNLKKSACFNFNFWTVGNVLSQIFMMFQNMYLT